MNIYSTLPWRHGVVVVDLCTTVLRVQTSATGSRYTFGNKLASLKTQLFTGARLNAWFFLCPRQSQMSGGQSMCRDADSCVTEIRSIVQNGTLLLTSYRRSPWHLLDKPDLFKVSLTFRFPRRSAGEMPAAQGSQKRRLGMRKRG